MHKLILRTFGVKIYQHRGRLWAILRSRSNVMPTFDGNSSKTHTFGRYHFSIKIKIYEPFLQGNL